MLLDRHHGLLALMPAAVLAGAALAIGNGLVDLERDAATGRQGIAVTLGRRAGWVTNAILFATVSAMAVLFAPAPTPTEPGDALATVRLVGLPVGVVAIALGALALFAQSPRLRERGWELEAVGVAVAGIAWLAGTAAVGSPG
jgi:4-hydroxybenzoate polyprenyltransferase